MTGGKFNGEEVFHTNGKPLGFQLVDFWRWAFSDTVSNATRGILAEFIVGQALGATDEIRDEWAPYDLKTSDGIRVEVKSAAFLQSWQQNGLSRIQFNLKQTIPWDPNVGQFIGLRKWHADVYVFALHKHKDKTTNAPLNLGQWEFYVLSVERLAAILQERKSLSLPSLQRETNAVSYPKLAEAVRQSHHGDTNIGA